MPKAAGARPVSSGDRDYPSESRRRLRFNEKSFFADYQCFSADSITDGAGLWRGFATRSIATSTKNTFLTLSSFHVTFLLSLGQR